MEFSYMLVSTEPRKQGFGLKAGHTQHPKEKQFPYQVDQTNKTSKWHGWILQGLY